MKTYSFQNSCILDHRCSPLVEAYYSRSWDHYDMDPHFHDRIEIMYLTRGSAMIHLYHYRPDSGNHRILVTRDRTERLTAGKCILLDRRVMHRLEVPDGAHMLNLEFILTDDPEAPVDIGRMAGLSKDLTDIMTCGRSVIVGHDREGRLQRAMEQTVSELAAAVMQERALPRILMAEVLLRLAEAARDAELRNNTMGYVRKAVSYLTSHLDESIRISDVAEEVGVAPAYLQRIFRQSTGMTIVDYLNRLRIQQSKHLLMFTEDPVTDVAIAAGFNSRQHFFRVFQAETGLSPREFRKAQGRTQGREVFEFDHVRDYWYDEEQEMISREDGARPER